MFCNFLAADGDSDGFVDVAFDGDKPFLSELARRAEDDFLGDDFHEAIEEEGELPAAWLFFVIACDGKFGRDLTLGDRCAAEATVLAREEPTEAERLLRLKRMLIAIHLRFPQEYLSLECLSCPGLTLSRLSTSGNFSNNNYLLTILPYDSFLLG